MNPSTVNWGIIGCGDVTEVKSGPAFNKVSNSKLVAVMRRDAAKAKDYAERHGVAKWYNNADELINDKDVDAIYVATPPLNHEEYTIKALHAGKPVYVEKPMALDANAAERMLEAANKTKVKLTVAHYRRQLPLFLKVKELLDQKAIGDVRLINLQMFQPHLSDLITKTETNWRVDPAVSGGGLFHDLAPHQLDLMLYFFGQPLKSSGIAINNAGFYEADDIVSGQVVFGNHILFNGIWGFTLGEKRDVVEIIGSEGLLRFGVFGQKKLVMVSGGVETTFEFEMPQHIQQPMIAKTTEFFMGNSENPCTAEEGFTVMKMIEAMTS